MSRMPYLQGIGLNARLMVFACALSASAASVFALTPLLRMSVSETLAGLKEGGRGSAGRNWRRLGAHLVVAELAVAVLLLRESAGLLGKSLVRLLHVDTGFNPQELSVVSVTPVSVESSVADGAAGAHEEQPGALARRVAERVAALPGVESVGYADLVPLGPGVRTLIQFLGRGSRRREPTARRLAGPAYQRWLLQRSPICDPARSRLHQRGSLVIKASDHHQRDGGTWVLSRRGSDWPLHRLGRSRFTDSRDCRHHQ